MDNNRNPLCAAGPRWPLPRTRTFARSMKKAELTDAALLAAVEEMSQGLVNVAFQRAK